MGVFLIAAVGFANLVDSIPKDRTMKQIIEVLKYDSESPEFQEAYKTIRKSPPDTALVSLLIKSLKDESPQVRYNCILLLAKVKTDEVFRVLSEAARTDTSLAVRVQAVWVLHSYGDKAIPILRDIALNDGNEAVGHWAYYYLACIGSSAVPLIIEIYENSKFKEKKDQIEIIRSLGKIVDRRLLDLLEEAALSDSDSWIRVTAVSILGYYMAEMGLYFEQKKMQSQTLHNVKGVVIDISILIHLGQVSSDYVLTEKDYERVRKILQKAATDEHEEVRKRAELEIQEAERRRLEYLQKWYSVREQKEIKKDEE